MMTEYTSFGIFNTAVVDELGDGSLLGCVAYSQYWTEQTFDRAFRAARFMAGGLMAFAALATFICLCLQCFSKSGKSWLWNFMRLSYLGAFFCQGAVYVVFMTRMCTSFKGEPSQCYLGRDGIIGAFNFVFLLGMVIATFQSFPPRHPVFQCWGASDMHDEDTSEDDISTKKEDVPMTTTAPAEAKDVAVEDVEMGGSGNDNMSVSLFSGTRSVVSIKSMLSKKEKANEEDIKKTDTDEEKSEDGLERGMKSKTSVAPSTMVSATGTVTDDNKDNISVTTDQTSRKSVGSMVRMWGRKSDMQLKTNLNKVPEQESENHADVDNTVTDDKNDGVDNLTKTDESDSESIQFLRSLAAVTSLKEGGIRVKTVERDHHIEMTDKYPAQTGEGLSAPHSSDGADLVKVRTEYYEGGSRMTKEITHHDGSRTVMTTIESKASVHKSDVDSISTKQSKAIYASAASANQESREGTEVSIHVEKVPSNDDDASNGSRTSVRKSSIPIASLRQQLENKLVITPPKR
jgi:hypothetical protein